MSGCASRTSTCHGRWRSPREERVDKDKAIAGRDKRIADLERQLAGRKRNSTNSSKHEHQNRERLTAAISYLIGLRKMTRRDVAATMQDVFGVDISVGSVQKAWEETADAVEAPYTELETALPTEPVLNSDETGSRTNGDKRWVWVLCSSWLPAICLPQ